jgi:hypothetical protein
MPYFVNSRHSPAVWSPSQEIRSQRAKDVITKVAEEAAHGPAAAALADAAGRRIRELPFRREGS